MNDTHAHVEPLPRMLTAINEVRAEEPEALLFHGGDVFSGTLYFNQYKGKADLALLNMMALTPWYLEIMSLTSVQARMVINP